MSVSLEQIRAELLPGLKAIQYSYAPWEEMIWDAETQTLNAAIAAKYFSTAGNGTAVAGTSVPLPVAVAVAAGVVMAQNPTISRRSLFGFGRSK